MGYPLTLALRYLGSKKRASISVGTAFAILGVALGVAALVTVMSVTGGFKEQFRDKVLGVNAHVLVMRQSSEFRNYREIMEQVKTVKGVVNVAPFSINPMMLRNGDKTATGVLVKGVDPERSLGVGLEGTPPVLDLPRHIVRGEGGECPKPSTMECGVRLLQGLRRSGATPPPTPSSTHTREELEIPDDDLAPPGSSGAAASPSSSASAPPDAGAPTWLREEKRHWDDVDAGAAAAHGEDADAPGADAGLAVDPGAPVGDITPDGGYKSKLPDEDDLPPELTKEACDDPELVKTLPGIVVGSSLADTLDLKIGGCVVVTSPTIGFQFSNDEIKPPVAKSFRVMAVFDAGFDQYDSKLVYTDLYEAQAFYGAGDTVTGIEMKISDIDASDDVVKDIRKVLPSEGYRVMDWAELNRGLFTALLIQQVAMSGVLALIILVAAFTVVATLIMVVLDKKREISVLKAMGATNGAILRVFLYQGGIIGGLGTGLGLLIGYGVCASLIKWAFPLDPKVYFIPYLPVLIRWQEFAITGAIAVALCLVATIFPSLYAADVRPADGFREQ
ncbi:MAG TPA: ABC transporter permease [Polyangiaceae bacterium]|nr:ABC transporter permease [Polyangiaceae bacterium]